MRQFPYLTIWGHKLKTPHASSGNWKQILSHLPASHKFHQIKWKTSPCPITKAEYLPYFILKFNVKCLHASGLSTGIAFSDTDLMLQFCLPYLQYPGLVLVSARGFSWTVTLFFEKTRYRKKKHSTIWSTQQWSMKGIVMFQRPCSQIVVAIRVYMYIIDI